MDVLKVEIVVPPSEVVQCGSLTQQPGWEEISDNLFCVGTEVPSSAKVPSEDKERCLSPFLLQLFTLMRVVLSNRVLVPPMTLAPR